MNSLEPLNDLGRVGGLTWLAQTALKAYPLEGAQVTLLRCLQNIIFRVDKPNGSRFVLRLHPPDSRTVEFVHSEMLWLAALRRETNLIVPEPMYTRDGALLTVIEAEEATQPRICVLFRWTPGQFLNRGLRAVHLERVGAFLAQLHLHAEQFVLPETFVRGRVDCLNEEMRLAAGRGYNLKFAREQLDPFSNEIQTQVTSVFAEGISLDSGEVVEATIQKMHAKFQQLDREVEPFGLIHADLHKKNYLFYQDKVHTIDFDDCGYGYFLYDLAVTLGELQYKPDYITLRAGLLSGYQRIRPLPTRFGEYLDAFIILRDLQILMWSLEMRNNPKSSAQWRVNAMQTFHRMKTFVTHV